MLKQSLQLKQQSKLSPLQMKLMKMIQLSSVALEQTIKEELVENPALEEGEETEEVEEQTEEENTDAEDGDENETESETEETDSEEEINIDDYLQDDEIPDYKTKANNTSPDDEEKITPVVVSTSFRDALTNQVLMSELNDEQCLIANQIIGSLDDDGYLRMSLAQISNDLAFAQNINADVQKIEEVLLEIQTFDPAGVGARSLQECLLLQLKRKPNPDEIILLTIQVLENYFREFSNKNYSKIIRDLNVSEDKMKEVIAEILKLNPKPGESASDPIRSQQTITPDFIITNTDGKLELSLVSGNIPELRISKYYRDMLQTYQENKKKNKADREAILFVKQKLDAAQGFISAISERQNTLLRTMTAIMNYQYEYFLTGDETKLKPMILKDIEAITDYDMSTISRVTNSKYIQTPHGTFLLKYFFSERVKTESGEDASAREVKRILMDLIESEDKKNPLTDEELMKALSDKDYKLARRTVAKYREMLSIPVARLRKEI